MAKVVPISDLMKLMGHSRIETTQRYLEKPTQSATALRRYIDAADQAEQETIKDEISKTPTEPQSPTLTPTETPTIPQ